MKKNELFFKSCIFSILFFNIFLILSCVSKPIPIPGESKILIENIYFEYLNIADKYFELEDYNKKYLSDWQEQPWLKGTLGIIFDGEGHFELNGIMLVYDREFGLREENEYGKV